MVCFSKACVGRLLGELHRSRDALHKVYRLANVVQTPYQEVKVEQSVLMGLLETGCLLNLYTTLSVRLHKHLSEGDPNKIDKGLHTCPLHCLWLRVLHTDPVTIPTMNTSACSRLSNQSHIGVVVVGISHRHTRTN